MGVMKIENHRLNCSCSKELKDSFLEKLHSFEYPSPDNDGVRIKFRSESDCLKWLVKCFVRMSDKEFELFSGWYNPYRRN